MSKYKIGDSVSFTYGTSTHSGDVSGVTSSGTASNRITYVVENNDGWIPTQDLADRYSLSLSSRYLYIRESNTL